jgi:hypothetical protein
MINGNACFAYFNKIRGIPDQQPGCHNDPVPQLPHDVTPIPIPIAAFSVAERGYLKFFGRGAKVFTKVMENKDTKN